MLLSKQRVISVWLLWVLTLLLLFLHFNATPLFLHPLSFFKWDHMFLSVFLCFIQLSVLSPPPHTRTHTPTLRTMLYSSYPQSLIAVYIFVLLSLSSSIFLVPRTSFSYYSCVPGLFFTSSSLACSRLSPTLCGSYAWHLPQPFDMLHFILWVSHVTLLGFVCVCDCFPQKVRVKQREKRMNKEEEFTHLARVC